MAILVCRPGLLRNLVQNFMILPVLLLCMPWEAGFALGAVLLLGARYGRYGKDGAISDPPPFKYSFPGPGGMDSKRLAGLALMLCQHRPLMRLVVWWRLIH